MLAKATNGYTAAAVDRVLQALDAPLQVQLRAELLDLDNMLLFPLNGLQLDGSITHNVNQPLQRGADLRFLNTERNTQHSAPLDDYISTILAQARLFHLRLGETSGNFADSSGNSRTFTANGGITYSVASLTAGEPLNNAITLNGTTGYLSIATAAWMSVAQFTLSMAFRGTGVSRTFFNVNGIMYARVDANGLLEAIINYTTGAPTNITIQTGIAVNDGLIHLLHVTYDKAHADVYLDGKRIAHVVETRTLAAEAGGGINVGRLTTGTEYANYTFDEVGFLGRALSPKEIRDEYQTWSAQTTELIFDKDRGDRIKIYYGITMPTAGTDGTYIAEWPLIVAVLTSPKKEYTETGLMLIIVAQDQCRVLASYTFTAAATLASGGNYITGTNGVLSIAQAVGLDTSGWAVTATTLTAPADVVFEIGSTALDAINYLLQAINYKTIRFGGDGAAVIEPNVMDKDLPLSDVINSTETRVIEAANLTSEMEARTTVNQVIIGNGNPDVTPIVGEATNSSVTSASSIVYTSPKAAVYQIDVPDQATATAIAQHMLANHTAAMTQRVRFRTLPRPFHDDRDRFDLLLPEININTVQAFVEDEWRLPLNPTQTMEHSMLAVVDVT